MLSLVSFHPLQRNQTSHGGAASPVESQGRCRTSVLRREVVLRTQVSARGTSDVMAEALPLCYHGSISRVACEELLGAKNKDGAYLIRDSETIQGALCLCVYKQMVVYTYRLLKTHSGQYTVVTARGLEETYFKSLDDLIQHYKRKNQGLAMHLRHSVKRKTALLIHPRNPAKSVPEQEQDYENDPNSSDYVKVLPSSSDTR